MLAVLHLSGVKEVANEVTVKPKVIPAAIKAQIEAAFERNAILRARQIRVRADPWQGDTDR